jgi:hypothetical protein
MVKFLALILALYVLLLPCVPCMDMDECTGDSATETSSSSTNHDNDENEACNPFCSCACCGQVFYPNLQPGKTAAYKPLIDLKYQSLYTCNALSSDFYGNIWQPPKLS